MSKQLTASETSIQSSVALFPIGQVGFDEFGREWMYCKSEGGTTAGYLCTITTDGAYDATSVTTATAGTPGTHWKLLGAPDIDMTDEYYGWYWIGGGTFELVVEDAFAATSDVVYTTDAAGICGADNSSFQIEGLKTIDLGVSATRVTVWAADRLTVGVVEAHD